MRFPNPFLHRSNRCYQIGNDLNFSPRNLLNRELLVIRTSFKAVDNEPPPFSLPPPLMTAFYDVGRCLEEEKKKISQETHQKWKEWTTIRGYFIKNIRLINSQTFKDRKKHFLEEKQIPKNICQILEDLDVFQSFLTKGIRPIDLKIHADLFQRYYPPARDYSLQIKNRKHLLTTTTDFKREPLIKRHSYPKDKNFIYMKAVLIILCLGIILHFATQR